MLFLAPLGDKVGWALRFVGALVYGDDWGTFLVWVGVLGLWGVWYFMLNSTSYLSMKEKTIKSNNDDILVDQITVS